MKKPLLIDLDGVLRIGNQPANGLQEFLDFISNNSIDACILSNSSINSSEQIYQFFEKNDIHVKIPIITAIDAAYSYVSTKYSKVAAYTSENVIHIFADLLEFEHPEAVLIGDIGDMWNYNLMQTIFEYVRNGAELIAAHKNKFWDKPEKGIQLDAGPFIHAIEYATSTKATLIGKPSQIYFEMALKKINHNIDEKFIMLGDDLDSDIAGSKKIGAETILIFTGKTKCPVEESYLNNINHTANNLFNVIEILQNN